MTLAERELEIERTRERLNGTIGKIQDKMTVSGVVDEVLGSTAAPIFETQYAKALDTVRTNPVPVLLIAAGLGWALNRLAKREDVARRRLRGQTVHADASDYRGGGALYDGNRSSGLAAETQAGAETKHFGDRI